MIKRHELYYTNDLGDDYPADSKDAEDGEWVAYADHAAFVERVREIAEGMEHDLPCSVARSAAALANKPKPECNCPRGQLLEACNG